jgi:transposase
MNFVGVDLHKKTITVCIVDRERRVLERKRLFCDQPERIKEFFTMWRLRQGPFEVTVEATASYEWFLELVEPLAERVVLAHPGKLRVIAESTRKSDKLDAQVLAEFLALDMIPQAYRPTPRQREHRVLVRHRQRIQKHITAAKNTIRRILSHSNQDVAGLFTRAGREYLRTVELSRADRFAVDQLCDQLNLLAVQLKAVDRQLAAFAVEASEREAEDRTLLCSIPGVGTVTTDVVLAEVGDVRRFPNAKKVIAYSGLAPGQRESAGKRKDLHIEKTGPRLLRWSLVEAAWRLVRHDPYWRSVFERIARHTGRKKKAIVAIARRLLGLMYALLKSRQTYRGPWELTAAA